VRRSLLLLLLLLLLSGSYLVAQPDSRQLEQYFQQGEKALSAGHYAEAEEAYEKLRRLDPGIAEVHGRLGLIYFQQGKFEQAVPALRQALKLKPSLPNTDILLAMSLSELGKYQEALPGLEKGFHQSADPALKRMSGLQLQRAYTGMAQDNKAVEVTLELARLYPEDPEVLYHASRLAANYAYLMLVKLSQKAPSSVWTVQSKGEAFESQGNLDAAIAQYRKVLELDPRRPGIHYRLGRVLLSRSQESSSRAEAAKEFGEELRIDPTNANAAYELGEIFRKSGEPDKAIERFESAVKYYPDFEEAEIGLGRVLIDLGKPDLALPHLRKALSLNAENEVTYYRLSQVYRALGNAAEQKKALAEFRRLRSLARQQDDVSLVRSPREVTRQELDPAAKP